MRISLSIAGRGGNGLASSRAGAGLASRGLCGEVDNNLRLDLQGKAREFNVGDVAWVSEPPNEYKTEHIAQFQVQFGHQGQTRLTKTSGQKTDYLTTHAGAIAGVMLGMRQVVSAADFRTALESSFNRIRDVGGQYFAVLMSNVAHPDDDRRWPTQYYWCPECFHVQVGAAVGTGPPTGLSARGQAGTRGGGHGPLAGICAEGY